MPLRESPGRETWVNTAGVKGKWRNPGMKVMESLKCNGPPSAILDAGFILHDVRPAG